MHIDINRTMCDHADILLPIASTIIGILSWLLYKEISIRRATTSHWHERIEAKLDLALEEHNKCQNLLPIAYVSRQEFKDLITERNKQWSDFTAKFDKFTDRFWNHQHTNGKVDINDRQI
jgi:hypothetical protein